MNKRELIEAVEGLRTGDHRPHSSKDIERNTIIGKALDLIRQLDEGDTIREFAYGIGKSNGADDEQAFNLGRDIILIDLGAKDIGQQADHSSDGKKRFDSATCPEKYNQVAPAKPPTAKG